MPWPSGGPRTWNPGETVTATQLNEQLRDALNILAVYVDTVTGAPSWFQHSEQTADVTKNANTTFADLPGMAIPVEANKSYLILAWVKLTSAAAADVKYTFTGPAAPTSVLFGLVSGGNPIVGAEDTFGDTISHATQGTIEESTFLWMRLENGANAGTVQLQFAQNASNASNSVARQHSAIIALTLI